ncbi:GerAB/ArcD/ProY family transporter [Paenibacillus albus]|uniref:Uncharacterized protein n=1 Tax=Paenibacillus albus TaxID=2495582 RepID=A0A3Q8X323_9BACL|nr:GerAB/ArcD/ProY family transporter [Paenibacillus albus]AZN38623.1 hypothetical protein EJC50_02225 [Paenibacillus albus]
MSQFSNPKISSLHATLFCINEITTLAQVSAFAILPSIAKRDAVISCAIGLIAYWCYTLWLFTILNKQTPGRSFLDALASKIGPVAAGILKGWILLYLVCEAFIICRGYIVFIKTMILPATPVWAITLPTLMLSVYLSLKGIKPLAIMITILTPAIVFMFLLQSVFTIRFDHFELLLPLFSEGWQPILHGALIPFRCGVDAFVLLLIVPQIQGRVKLSHLVASILYVTILLLNTTVSILTTFGPYEAIKQRYPSYMQWRLVRISSFIEHVDFFAMFQWTAMDIVMLALAMWIIMNLFFKKDLHQRIGSLTLAAILLVGMELHIGDEAFAVLRNYYYPISTISVLCWTAIAQLTTRKGVTS